MDFTTLTIELLRGLAHFVGNYGIAIIVLTVIVRIALWPLNVSQQRSMRTMQTLQPKMKAIQDRYKNDPQKMQQKMMEFYKEHKFNPMGGCLPLLIQMPIFILLYSALMSPQFIQMAGDTSFLFIHRLDTTLRATAGISNDGVMGASQYDNFVLGKTAKVILKNNEVLDNVKIDKPNKALEIQGQLVPGENIEFKMSLDHLDLKFSQLDNIATAEMSITDLNTKETEKVNFVHCISSVNCCSAFFTLGYSCFNRSVRFDNVSFSKNYDVNAKQCGTGSNPASYSKINGNIYAYYDYRYIYHNPDSGRCVPLSDYK